MKLKLLAFLSLLLTVGTSSAAIVHQILNNVTVSPGVPYTLVVSNTSIVFEYSVFGPPTGIYLFDMNFTDNVIATTDPANWDQLSLKAINEVIDGSLQFNVDGSTSFGTGPGQFNAGAEPQGVHYLGIKTVAGNFGWVKINVSSGVSYTIEEYAYEDVVNTAILTGATGGATTVLVTDISVQGQGNVNAITTAGGTLQMEATVLPANATNNTVTWSVANGTGSASISAIGLLTALTDGIVTVTATANDGSNVTGDAEITISNQVASIGQFQNWGINLYPNPATDRLYITDENSEVQAINIYDLSGRKVWSETAMPAIENEVNIDFLEVGIYVVALSLKNGTDQSHILSKK